MYQEGNEEVFKIESTSSYLENLCPLSLSMRLVVTVTTLLLYATLAVSGLTLYAQTHPQSQNPVPPTAGKNYQDIGEGDVVRVKTDLVTIPFSVLDRNGRYITGLRQEDVHIYEDGVEQEISFFNSVDQPISVVLLLDTSDSTRTRLPAIKKAALVFIEQMRPTDVVLPLSFDYEIHTRLRTFTNDRALLREAVHSIETGKFGVTKLYSAIDWVYKNVLKNTTGRKAMILLSDGEDTASIKATKQGTLWDSMEYDTFIYTVQYDPTREVEQTRNPVTGPRPLEYFAEMRAVEAAARYLRSLATNTGGRFYQASSTEMEQTFVSIAEELRGQYAVSYYPKKISESKQRRQVKVQVNRSKVSVMARQWYIYDPQSRR